MRYQLLIDLVEGIIIQGLQLGDQHFWQMTPLESFRVKTFVSQNLSLSDPCDIAVFSDQKAVVTTDNKLLVLLDISGHHMSSNNTTRVSYEVRQDKKSLICTWKKYTHVQ